MKHAISALKGFALPAVLFAAGWCAASLTAQSSTAQAHIAAARAAAYEPGHDFTVVFDTLCAAALSDRGPAIPGPQVAAPLATRRVPPRSEWYMEPAKVFDNLFFIGTQEDSVWAVSTTDGIILIDSAYDYNIKELTDGLRRFGLDPINIKYVVLSHAHGDRYFGSRFLQDTYHPRIVMSDADWEVMAKSNEPADVKPKKDMVATDGMKLTLGDTTLTLYLTPGHTPGTISTLVPLKDGTQRHVGMVWGGMNPSYERYGVRYYSTLADTFKAWSGSLRKFQDTAARAGADVYLSIHPYYDKTPDKIHALNFRGPSDPHTFVSGKAVQRFLTVMAECTEAQLARVTDK
jgi:metallo-beta-lactamase class B